MSTELFRTAVAPEIKIRSLRCPHVLRLVGRGIKRRWLRERRRRKVGRAYDMALEIARVIPRGSEVLDVGCGNGFIAHHLSAMLGATVIGIDVMNSTEAQIDYRQYDGANFPLPDNSVDVALLCYVLHHAQDVCALLNEIKRVLRPHGLAIIYEDLPETAWDRFICWSHNSKWQRRTGKCTFRKAEEWQRLFALFGFQTIKQSRLSRCRNFLHPVMRRFYELKANAAIRAPATQTYGGALSLRAIEVLNQVVNQHEPLRR